LGVGWGVANAKCVVDVETTLWPLSPREDNDDGTKSPATGPLSPLETVVSKANDAESRPNDFPGEEDKSAVVDEASLLTPQGRDVDRKVGRVVIAPTTLRAGQSPPPPLPLTTEDEVDDHELS
jgi:hypothetical protein